MKGCNLGDKIRNIMVFIIVPKFQNNFIFIKEKGKWQFIIETSQEAANEKFANLFGANNEKNTIEEKFPFFNFKFIELTDLPPSSELDYLFLSFEETRKQSFGWIYNDLTDHLDRKSLNYLKTVMECPVIGQPASGSRANFQVKKMK